MPHSSIVTNTQLTLVQIGNYGLWTITPDSRREMDLQTLQSRLFANLAQYVSSHDGYALFTRFDNMVTVTSDLDRGDHELLQESITNHYPVTFSLGIGVDRSPVVALERTTDCIQRVGSAQDDDRREVPSGEAFADTGCVGTNLQTVHFDANDATDKYTDRLSESDTFIHIEQGYVSLMRYLREEHSALSFFAGGDNIISVMPGLTEDQYCDAIDHVEAEADVELKVGVGTASNAHGAGFAAKHALEDCRHRGTIAEYADVAAEIADD